VRCMWRAVLARRSQRGQVSWKRHRPFLDRWIPVDRVREVLAQERTPAEMVEVEVKDAATALKVSLGSPSIRVDGQDVEPAARAVRAFRMMCRTYDDGGRRAGVPPAQWIRAAVREAKGR
jgi:hypothetical protein